MKKIFVSVASYRDPELGKTLLSAIEKASNPNNIYFGIVYQGSHKERPLFDFVPNYSLISMHPKDARGVGLARSKAMTLYNNEDYYLQIDSHTQFVKNWDLKCIEQLELAQSLTKNKVILSSFPPPYINEGPRNKVIIPIRSTKEHPVYPTKQIVVLRKTNEWGAERVDFDDEDMNLPEISNTVLGGFIFTYGRIVNDVPYDPEISFFGEEICFAARAWTRGYDIYSPCIPIVYHFYTRIGHKKIWNENSLNISWKEIQDRSREKQKMVLCGIEKGIYGVGKERKLKDYERLIGFDFKTFYGIE